MLNLLLGAVATGATQAASSGVSRALATVTGQRVNVPCEGGRHARRIQQIQMGQVPPDVAAAQGYTGTPQDKIRVFQIMATNQCVGQYAQAWLDGQGNRGDGSLGTRTSQQGSGMEDRAQLIREIRDAMFIGGAQTQTTPQDYIKTNPGVPSLPTWVPYAVMGVLGLVAVVALMSKRK